MRLWSLHPSLLDAKGLVALWREGLLARAVLLGRTRGYRHHPQLRRFAGAAAIDCYLSRVLDESRARGYRFDASKIRYRPCRARWPVTQGQLEHEWTHLLRKLAARDPRRRRLALAAGLRVHPCFRAVPGPVEPWEASVAAAAPRPGRASRRRGPQDRARHPP